LVSTYNDVLYLSMRGPGIWNNFNCIRFSLILLLFWQISAMDLESMNVKFLFYKCRMLDLFFIIIFVVCSEKRAAPPFKSRRINSKVMPLQARCGPEGGYSYSSTVL